MPCCSSCRHLTGVTMMQRAVIACLAAMLVARLAGAQTHEEMEQAFTRIEEVGLRYVADGARALKEGNPKLALDKLKSAISILGEHSGLLYTAAEAAFQAGDIAQAEDFAKRSYAAADDEFKRSEEYQKLLALSARMREGPKLVVETRAPWVDQRTGLMWMAKDNASDIDWNAADTYCRQLAVEALSDWRLPEIAELERIYDPSSEFRYQITSPLELTSWWVWSATKSRSSHAWSYHFSFGQRSELGLDNQFGVRALCVRDTATSGGGS
jgi:tetratricopeptide (TPR) repeat protein